MPPAPPVAAAASPCCLAGVWRALVFEHSFNKLKFNICKFQFYFNAIFIAFPDLDLAAGQVISQPAMTTIGSTEGSESGIIL
jgi:hypothetical protein